MGSLKSHHQHPYWPGFFIGQWWWENTMNDINNTTCQAYGVCMCVCLCSGRYISVQLFSNIVDSWIIHIPLLLCLSDHLRACSLPTRCWNQTVYVGCLSLSPLCASSPSERNLRLSRLFLWTAHQSLRKHYTAGFEVRILFFLFFLFYFGWDLVMVLRLSVSLHIWLNYMYKLQCKWGNCFFWR